ncbi:Kinesin-like protein KIF16B [Holothuria leucospilota]|uniref:Kinesin-like protein KIF16B n=1 Tax=Holothuria leucospilota TaxID=206669 RepID=A0A9Q1CH14_HOLLE|nr:Kinesin-like protein KIF16B [Holothuria leucospilota]
MASVKVAVRVRPINKREINLGSTCIISVEGNKTSITNLKIPAGAGGSAARDGSRERVKSFTYDYSYWSVNPNDAHFASQELVHSHLGTDVLKAAFEGYNACIFAYGQTGSGKSYTMMGEEHCPGLIPRICEGLYQRIKSVEDDAVSYRTEVSYLEIYCERVRDLLRDSKDHNLRVREHPRDGPYVQNLSKHIVSDYSDIKTLMDQGNIQRTTASTNMNDVSSRSHAIFTIRFTQAKFNEDMPSETVSKINLVDLAGSERADSTGATGERLKEGANINKSLVTLGNVISALADISLASNCQKPTRGKRKSLFIPYRDSVLTWLLKDSLGGNSKTIMVATISPADVNYGETLSTLRYANRAKDIINKPTINEDPNIKLIRELRAEITRLKKRLGDMGGEETSNETETAVVDKLHENEARVKILTEEWATKWKDAQKLMQDKNLALRSDGNIIMVDIELPHLIAIDDDILSTGLKIYHIHEGKTSIGNNDAAEKPDIALTGHDVENNHCYLTSAEGKVWLDPCGKALCAVNGKVIDGPVQLKQGCLVSVGKTNLFRFNHPADAQRMRLEMKSQSLSDLSNLKSTENLLASTFFQTYGREKDEDKDELEQLEEKRSQLEDLAKNHAEEEARRQKELEKKDAEVKELQLQLEKLKKEGEEAERRVKEASQVADKEQKRLARRSVNLMKQVEEFEKQKEVQQKEMEEKLSKLEEEKKQILAERDEALAKLEEEKQALRKQIAEEKSMVQELEAARDAELSELQSDLVKQRKALEMKIEQQRQAQAEEAKKLDQRARELDAALKTAQKEFEAKREQLQRERDEERHFLDMEREKVEAHRAKHELAIKLAEKMEETAKQQLSRESHEIAKARDEFERRKQRQLEVMEDAEKSIEAKAESLVNEIWESRALLDEDLKTLEEQEKEKKAMLLDSREQLTPAARELLEKQLKEIVLEIKSIETAQKVLDEQEEDVEKLIEKEFIALEQRKRDGENKLEEEWKQLLDIEAANLWFIEQEVTERNDALDMQRKNLEEKESKLKEFQIEQSKTLDKLSEDKRVFSLERDRILESFESEMNATSSEISNLKEKMQGVKEKYLKTSPLESELSEAAESLKQLEEEEEEFAQKEDEIAMKDEEILLSIDQDIEDKVKQLEELKQTESFVDGKYQEERKNLSEKLENIQALERQVEEAQQDLMDEKRKFDLERRREIGRIEAEKMKIKDLEKQERMQKLIEEQVQQRLTEEFEERQKERQREQKEREQMLEQMRMEHQQELQELREKLRQSAVQEANRSSSPDSTDGSENNDPARRISQLIEQPLTPNTADLRDPIKITIPKFMLRGHGWDSFYVFEVHISVLEESWVVYRRYSKFRELHDYMRQKFPQIGALQFPPKRFLGNRSEKVVQKRKVDLENYLQNFITICQKIPTCPIAPGPGRVLSKQELCDFSFFFRKGAFEETKYVSG